jgi:hypothetical protein
VAFAGLGALALLPIVPVQAAGPALATSGRPAREAAAPKVSRSVILNSNLLALYQIVSGQNQCFVYTYDQNGNRLTRSNLNPTATAAWGTAVYGCYNWTTP